MENLLGTYSKLETFSLLYFKLEVTKPKTRLCLEWRPKAFIYSTKFDLNYNLTKLKLIQVDLDAYSIEDNGEK